MKILFVTNEIPYPPDNGVRIVSYNAMRLMKESGHELALAVLTVETDNVSKRYEVIKSFCKDGCSFIMHIGKQNRLLILLRAFLHNRMFPVERYSNKLFRNKLEELIGKFEPDVVHFDIITMAQYRDVVPHGIGVIASINDSYSLTLENLFSTGQYSGFQYLYRKVQYYQSRMYERSVYETFDSVHVMTDVDANYLHKLNNNINICVIPNGVESNLFSIYQKTFTKTDVIFVAKMVGENICSLKKFINLSWPIIRSDFPKTKLYVVGKINKEAKSIENEFNNVDGITFMGYVERLEEAYGLCGIAIVPIDKNCGIINKLIEAMVSGLAVVGFDKSFSGIKLAKNNEHYVSVSDYKEMGSAVVELLRNKEFCQEIKSAAHLFAVDQFSWSSRIGDYEKMYQYAVDHAKRCA